jgi:hypothetical protein
MRLSGDQVSIKVPQREGDGRQALASSPLCPAPAASLVTANLPYPNAATNYVISKFRLPWRGHNYEPGSPDLISRAAVGELGCDGDLRRFHSRNGR